MAKLPPHVRRRWFYRILLALGFLTMLGLGLLFKHYVFPMQQVRISGHNFQEESALRTYLEKERGDSLLWLRWRLPKKLTAQFPKIAYVKLSISWPDTLTVTVIEKEPWLAFLGDQGSVVIAKDGTVLSDGAHQVSLPEKGNLLIIRGLPDALFAQTKLSETVLKKLRTIVDRVKYHFPDAAMQMDCTGVDFASEFEGLDDVILVKDDQIPIRLGSLVGLEEKLVLLKTFFWHYNKEEEPKPIEYIDLRAKGKIIVKYNG